MTPSEKFNKPVIGNITTAPLDAKVGSDTLMENITFPAETYEVIDIVPARSGEKIYVCNLWNSPDVVQLVPCCLVACFTPKAA